MAARPWLSIRSRCPFLPGRPSTYGGADRCALYHRQPRCQLVLWLRHLFLDLIWRADGQAASLARMKIATFNINGVRARIETLTGWLAAAQPDVVVLQEIKTQDEGFPHEPIADLGYNIETHGQKGFNGVAILSRLPLEDVSRGLPGDDGDEQARYIEATVVGRDALRIAGLYLPNGNPQPGPKFDYKLAWMQRLHDRARALLKSEMPVAMMGDYNVIPEPRDAAFPEKWVDDALFQPES